MAAAAAAQARAQQELRRGRSRRGEAGAPWWSARADTARQRLAALEEARDHAQAAEQIAAPGSGRRPPPRKPSPTRRPPRRPRSTALAARKAATEKALAEKRPTTRPSPRPPPPSRPPRLRSDRQGRRLLASQTSRSDGADPGPAAAGGRQAAAQAALGKPPPPRRPRPRPSDRLRRGSGPPRWAPGRQGASSVAEPEKPTPRKPWPTPRLGRSGHGGVNGSGKKLESSIAARTAAEKALAEKQAPLPMRSPGPRRSRPSSRRSRAERKRSDASRNGLAAA